jgi:hypothetical protein
MSMDHRAFVSVVAEAFCASLKADMDKNKAGNYACFEFCGDDAKYLAMFTRLPDGKTPMELHAECKAEVERLRSLLERIDTECGNDTPHGYIQRMIYDELNPPNSLLDGPTTIPAPAAGEGEGK